MAQLWSQDELRDRNVHLSVEAWLWRSRPRSAEFFWQADREMEPIYWNYPIFKQRWNLQTSSVCVHLLRLLRNQLTAHLDNAYGLRRSPEQHSR